jgi:hypothetical protein
MLLSGDGPSAQTAAKNNHDRQKAPPRIIMDTTAELLLAKYQSPLEMEQRDAYGWFCRLLSHKGGPRYAKVLEMVEAGAADEKLRRWAAIPVEPAPGADPTPYVPGSIKLADLASVYPVPYPSITMPRMQ